MNLSIKEKQNQTLKKKKNNHRHREQPDGCQGEEHWLGRRCKLLYIEWINDKIILYSTENY